MKRTILQVIVAGVIISNLIGISANADVPANMLPVYKNGENVDVTTNGANMNIKINGGENGVGSANWSSFHIGKDAGVNVEFTNKNQTSLNYVDAAGGMSQIYGKFTDSGVGADTGKIILQNPNGVFFGNGANVNVNSFTATTMNGVYDKNSQTLKLTKNANANKDYGIIVDSGAKINGRKGVAFASNNIDVYKGSQISSKTYLDPLPDGAIGYEYDTLEPLTGNVKLVTSDGVNFAYQDTGKVYNASDIKASTDKMMLYVAGSVEGKNIEMNNASTNAASQINMKGAVLKATGAIPASDGNIILTSNNKVVTEDTKFTTDRDDKNVLCYYFAPDYVPPEQQFDVKITAKNNISLNKNNIDSTRNVTLKSENGNVNVHNSKVSGSDIMLDAGNVASIQVNSEVEGSDVTVNGGLRGQIVSSNVKASKINITSDKGLAWTKDSTLVGNSWTDSINIKSKQDGVLLQNTKFEAPYGNINVQAYKSIKSSDLAGSKFITGSQYGENVSIKSSNNVDLNDLSQFQANKKLNLGGLGVNVETEGDLNVKNTNFEGMRISLKSKNGNLTVDGDTTEFNVGFPSYAAMMWTDDSGSVSFEAGKDVKTTGKALPGHFTNITAGNDIDVKLDNAILTATSGNNMKVSTDKTLYINKLTSGKNMTLNANKIEQNPGGMAIPYTHDSTDPSRIPNIIAGGEFNTNVNYNVLSSTGATSDGQYNTEHIIQIGGSNFYLKNKLPKSTTQQVTPPTIKPRDLGGEDEV